MSAAQTRKKHSEIRKIFFPSGRSAPALGQGTWGMGEHPGKRREEIAALRLGLDLGMTLIDTAEMYGEGAAEELVGEAIEGRREEVFLCTKVYPHNASKRGVQQACRRSLERLKTDYLDLYLLHWRGALPIEDTLEGFQLLKDDGKIWDYGVSNFDVDDMEIAVGLPGGEQIVTDQVLYNLAHRGIEWDLLPWCRERGIPIMAYSPIEQGEMLDHPRLAAIADRHGATPAQIALAWLLRNKDIMITPKASKKAHVRDNRAALDLELTDDDLNELDHVFPPPDHKIPLEMK